jgi:hypothetical protein
MASSEPDLRVNRGNGFEEISLAIGVNSSNCKAVCDRISQRLTVRRSKGFGGQDVVLSLTGKQMDALLVSRLLRCFTENEVSIIALRLGKNKLDDFDMEHAFGSLFTANQRLSELDLSDNEIGDFGLVCLLRLVLSEKSNAPLRILLHGNMVSHPQMVLDAVPADLRKNICALGFGDIEPDRAQIVLTGLESQKCGRSKLDFPEQLSLKVPATHSSQRDSSDLGVFDDW